MFATLSLEICKTTRLTPHFSLSACAIVIWLLLEDKELLLNVQIFYKFCSRDSRALCMVMLMPRKVFALLIEIGSISAVG